MKHYITKSKSGHYTLTLRADSGSKIGCFRKIELTAAKFIWERIKEEGLDAVIGNVGFKFERF